MELISKIQDKILQLQASEVSFKDDCCPKCPDGLLKKHGFNKSWFYDIFSDHRVTLPRRRCNKCNHVVTNTVQGLLGQSLSGELIKIQSELGAQYSYRDGENLINRFSSKKRRINNVDNLYDALPAELKNEENKAYLRNAMDLTVNASGANIIMVDTDEGVQLVYGNSQRRKKVVSATGACKSDESMKEAANKRFFVELGNPDPKGILARSISEGRNISSLVITNKIGEKSLEEIAKSIVREKAKPTGLYINVSALYYLCDDPKISIADFKKELEEINSKLHAGAGFYNKAVTHQYDDTRKGTVKTNLAIAENRAIVCVLIKEFKETCNSLIPSTLSECFSKNFNAPDTLTEGELRQALEAIIGLTENSEIGLVSPDKLRGVLGLDLSIEEVKRPLASEYFLPAFKNVIAHRLMLDLTPKEFVEAPKEKRGPIPCFFSPAVNPCVTPPDAHLTAGASSSSSSIRATV